METRHFRQKECREVVPAFGLPAARVFPRLLKKAGARLTTSGELIWGHWKTWPHLTSVQDRGGDDRSSMYALSYHRDLQLNISMCWDKRHDAWWGWLETMRSCGLQGLTLLIMIT